MKRTCFIQRPQMVCAGVSPSLHFTPPSVTTVLRAVSHPFKGTQLHPRFLNTLVSKYRWDSNPRP